MRKLSVMDAARQFVLKYHPHCEGALLAGSVVRGQATETSDLDIVVFDGNLSSSYRKSFIEFGWNIELFAHNLTSYAHFFKQDCESGRPSMPWMVNEGIPIRDNGVLNTIKREAKDWLQTGPERWSEKTIKEKQYFITDCLEDLIGCEDREEGLFIVGKLAELVSEFMLRTNGKWTGTSKWAFRSLVQYDVVLAKEFTIALDYYYKTNNKSKIIIFVDKVLLPYGGRFFEGFSIGMD
ncbi:nucleotidyltransferase domain-containing protein [Bacillus coahuilensis]|nr:nucleotidyltransferase domain-containing protein [Bacillus coahuilensis]